MNTVKIVRNKLQVTDGQLRKPCTSVKSHGKNHFKNCWIRLDDKSRVAKVTEQFHKARKGVVDTMCQARRTHRQVVGLLNYMSADRPDCCVTITEPGREVRRPTSERWQMLRGSG